MYASLPRYGSPLSSPSLSQSEVKRATTTNERRVDTVAKKGNDSNRRQQQHNSNKTEDDDAASYVPDANYNVTLEASVAPTQSSWMTRRSMGIVVMVGVVSVGAYFAWRKFTTKSQLGSLKTNNKKKSAAATATASETSLKNKEAESRDNKLEEAASSLSPSRQEEDDEKKHETSPRRDEEEEDANLRHDGKEEGEEEEKKRGVTFAESKREQSAADDVPGLTAYVHTVCGHCATPLESAIPVHFLTAQKHRGAILSEKTIYVASTFAQWPQHAPSLFVDRKDRLYQMAYERSTRPREVRQDKNGERESETKGEAYTTTKSHGDRRLGPEAASSKREEIDGNGEDAPDRSDRELYHDKRRVERRGSFSERSTRSDTPDAPVTAEPSQFSRRPHYGTTTAPTHKTIHRQHHDAHPYTRHETPSRYAGHETDCGKRYLGEEEEDGEEERPLLPGNPHHLHVPEHKRREKPSPPPPPPVTRDEEHDRRDFHREDRQQPTSYRHHATPRAHAHHLEPRHRHDMKEDAAEVLEEEDVKRRLPATNITSEDKRRTTYNVHHSGRPVQQPARRHAPPKVAPAPRGTPSTPMAAPSRRPPPRGARTEQGATRPPPPTPHPPPLGRAQPPTRHQRPAVKPSPPKPPPVPKKRELTKKEKHRELMRMAEKYFPTNTSEHMNEEQILKCFNELYKRRHELRSSISDIYSVALAYLKKRNWGWGTKMYFLTQAAMAKNKLPPDAVAEMEAIAENQAEDSDEEEDD